jgi:Arylsulfotransferase (ASST)
MAAKGMRLTRRGFVAAGGAALAGVLVSRAPARAAGSARLAAEQVGYVSRPDLKPPTITVLEPADRAAPGYIFLAPFDIAAASSSYTGAPASESHAGPLIVDDAGEPIWFLPLAKDTAMGMRVQELHGRPVLTWYEGTVLGAYGGDFVVFDPTYHEVARIRAGRGRHGDLHEFLLTPQGTALITIYREVQADLTSIGGAADGRLVEGIVQELDVATGRVLFEWRSRDHVTLDETFTPAVTPAGNVDYFHLNSVDVDGDGHLLVSARNTSTVYKIDRRTGTVIWRLGGKRSTFTVTPDASFAYQHDARRQPDGTITIFDNASGAPGPGPASRGLRLSLDMKRRRASLVQEYKTPDARAVWAMGNVQQLGDGGVFIGWGTHGSFSEFGPHGRLRFDARFADKSVDYRAFRLPWLARPTGKPAVGVQQAADGSVAVYASWNGATEVATWQVRAGASPERLRAVATGARRGFETAIPVPALQGYVAVAALDRAGRRLGLSDAVAV